MKGATFTPAEGVQVPATAPEAPEAPATVETPTEE
jgi:hypothetical protein